MNKRALNKQRRIIETKNTSRRLWLSDTYNIKLNDNIQYIFTSLSNTVYQMQIWYCSLAYFNQVQANEKTKPLLSIGYRTNRDSRQVYCADRFRMPSIMIKNTEEWFHRSVPIDAKISVYRQRNKQIRNTRSHYYLLTLTWRITLVILFANLVS